MPPDSTSSARFVLTLLLLVVMLAASGCFSGVGDQNDGEQVAVAAVVGAGEPVGGAYQVRSGSEVLLSGKDSDSSAAPLFTFEWEQITGTPVQLFERDATSRSFTAPNENTTLAFRLKTTNVNGVETSDTVTVRVTKIVDSNDLLRDPKIQEDFYLFVAPDVAGSVATRTTYNLRVTPVVTWTGRDGAQRTTGIAGVAPLEDILNVSDVIEAGFNAPASGVDPAQDRHKIAIPLLDFDEINEQFQGTTRGGRLEFEQIDDAQFSLLIALSGVMGSADLEVFVARSGSIESSGAPFFQIEGNRVYPDMPATSSLPRDAILNDTRSTVSIDVEKLRQEIGAESKGSAQNYYDCIDPLREATTLDDWIAQAGVSFVRARYLNNYDLGFGRDMFVGSDVSGNVYSYVVNYPSLESLLKGTGEFATVVMEYSDAPTTGFCGVAPGPGDPVEKIVKFYAYSPNSQTGVMERTLSQNFDGRGERFLPGVCTACHDGAVSRISDFGPIDPTTRSPRTLRQIPASTADLDATFMPWDLDSFLFAKAADASLVDPSLNQSDFTSRQLDDASLESQREAFRAFNEATLATYLPESDVDSPERTATLQRFEAPIRLIHLWYGNKSAIAVPIESTSNTRAILGDVGSMGFRGTGPDRVQEGWAGEEDLYHDVYARNCRMCHTQQDALALNFDTYAKFTASLDRLEEYVFDRGLMPSSRLTLDRFWLDFRGGTPAAEILRTHLDGLGRDVAGRTPGEPRAVVSITTDPAGTPIDDGTELGANPTTGAFDPTNVLLDGTDSLFAEHFTWTVTVTPDGVGCSGSASVASDRESRASFVVDSSPCEYSVRLEVLSGTSSDESAPITFTSDRRPVADNFAASTLGFVPGDDFLDIDVFDRSRPSGGLIGDFGDAPLSLTTTTAGVTVDNPNGRLRIGFDPFIGVDNETIDYAVLDDDVDSAAGQVTVDVPPISVVVIPDGVMGSSATLKWTVTDMFLADAYALERDGPTLDGIFTTVAGCSPAPASCTSDPMSTCSCTDGPLMSGAEYNYRVRSTIGAYSSTTMPISVSTLAVPQGVMSVQAGSQVNVTWGQGGGITPAGYNIFRENLDGPPGSVSMFVDNGSAPLSYADTSIEQNTQYRYSVSQFDGGGNESARSAAPSAIITNVGPPRSPTAVVGTPATSSVNVSFLPPTGGIDPGSSGYTIERQANGGSFTPITPTLSQSPSFPFTYSFNQTGLASDTAYAYRITAVGRNGSSAPATSTTATTSVSYNNDIAGFYLSPVPAFSVGCSGGACHFSAADWKGDITDGSLLTTSCLIDNDFNISECSASHSAGWTISSTMRDLLRRWRSQGFLD